MIDVIVLCGGVSEVLGAFEEEMEGCSRVTSSSVVVRCVAYVDVCDSESWYGG